MDGIFQYDTEVWNYWNLSTLWWGAWFELMLRLFTMWNAQEELLSIYLFGYPVGCFRSRLTMGIFQLWSLDYYLHVMYVLTYIYIYMNSFVWQKRHRSFLHLTFNVHDIEVFNSLHWNNHLLSISTVLTILHVAGTSREIQVSSTSAAFHC